MGKKQIKPRKYIISVVSIISTYKQPILQALHNYIPYSSYLKNDIHDSTDALFIKAKQELEREDIQCVILKKNNHRGRQRKYMFEQLESLNDKFDIKHIVLDFVGYERELNTTEFRNYLFSRVMKTDTSEVINPIDMKLSEIEEYILNFTSEYTPLALAKQLNLYDLVISLNFKNPSVFHSLTTIVTKLQQKYGKDLLMNVTKHDISKFSVPFDNKIKRIEGEIKNEGVLSMSGYVYEHETSKLDNLPMRYVVIPVTIKYSGYEEVNKILNEQHFKGRSTIITIDIPRDFKDKLMKEWVDNDVVFVNATNETIMERNQLNKALSTFHELYRYRAIWLDYVPFISDPNEESQELEINLQRFYKSCIRSYTLSNMTIEEKDSIVKKVFQSGIKFQQIMTSELEFLKHYFIDMTMFDDEQKIKVGDVEKYVELFIKEISDVYPKLFSQSNMI